MLWEPGVACRIIRTGEIRIDFRHWKLRLDEMNMTQDVKLLSAWVKTEIGTLSYRVAKKDARG